MQVIEVAGVGEVEFPDDMSQEQIKSVLDQKFGQTQPEQKEGSLATQFGKGFHDAGASLIGMPVDAMEALINAGIYGYNKATNGDVPQLQGSVGGSKQIQDLAPAPEPQNTAESAARIVGGLVPAVASGGAALKHMATSPTVKGKLAQGAGLGGLEAGVMSQGETNEERGKNITFNTPVGAAFGFGGAGLASYVTGKAAKNAVLKEQVQAVLEGNPSKKVVEAMVKGGEKAGASKALQNASKQGFDNGMLSVILGSDNVNKRQMVRMLKTQMKAMDDPLFAQKSSPSKIVGESIAKRYKHVLEANKQAGKEIDKVSKSLVGKKVDYASVADDFLQQLDDAGVALDDKGLNFNGSDFDAFPSSQSLIKKVFKQASTVKDAHDVHKMKRTIDRLVTYGKTNSKSADIDAERLVKSFRAEMDALLDGKFADYDAANNLYRETIDPLNRVNELVGKNSSVNSPNFAKTLGTISNRISSRAASGGRVDDVFSQLDEVAESTGGQFADDYNTLSAFSNELDRRFGTTANNSLQGQTRNAGESLLRSGSVKQVIKDKALDAVDGMRGVNDDAAFESLRALLTE